VTGLISTPKLHINGFKLQRLTQTGCLCWQTEHTVQTLDFTEPYEWTYSNPNACYFKHATTQRFTPRVTVGRVSDKNRPWNFYEINIKRATRSRDRIPEARFYTPVQTGLGTHPASYTMWTGSLAPPPGGRGSGRGMALTTHTSSAEVKERVELYLYLPSGPSLPVLRVKWNRVLRVEYRMFFVGAPPFPTTYQPCPL